MSCSAPAPLDGLLAWLGRTRHRPERIVAFSSTSAETKRDSPDAGERELAATIARRWIERNLAVFQATGKLVEKYDVTNADATAGGGEYPLQDGFGWTNGVLRALLDAPPR